MKRVISLLMAALLILCALPVSAMAETWKTVYISSTGSGTLNLRSGPGKDYDVVGYVNHGDEVQVLKKSGEWSRVKTEDGDKGWIKTKYIDGTTKSLGSGTKTVKTSGGSLNLRSGPGTSYGVKGQVANGAKVKVLNTEGSWVKITVQSSGKTGWIQEKYISGSGSSSGSGSGSSSSGSAQKVYHVTSNSLNVRSGAGTGYGWKATLSKGQGFIATGSSGNWFKIKTFTGVTGWVSKTYAAAGATAKVTASSLNMRSKAGTSGSVIKSLGYGTRVTVNSVTGNWANITSGGKSGYVSMTYLAF